MKKALITGMAGQYGLYLVELLLEEVDKASPLFVGFPISIVSMICIIIASKGVAVLFFITAII